ncbi:MAG: cbb3-type cytochrome c oxidase N-terminal domain-containing protein [Tepidisphaeraceae bacterium]
MSQLEMTPNSPPEDNLTGHNYDGIQEYDNPAPGWWTWIFVITVFFSFFYVIVFVVGGDDQSVVAYYNQANVELMKAQYGQLGDVKGDDETLLKLMRDEKWNKVGASIFQSNCVTCHGADGSGIAGPNLTDEFYINVKKVSDIYDVVNRGRQNGAMPAWGQRLPNVEQVLVSAYVASLRGQNKPSVGGRPKEGNAAEPWPVK